MHNSVSTYLSGPVANDTAGRVVEGPHVTSIPVSGHMLPLPPCPFLPPMHGMPVSSLSVSADLVMKDNV